MAEQSDTAAHWREEDYVKAVEENVPSRVLLIAVDGCDIVGFIVALSVGYEWEIENVVVDPERLRRGLGDALMDAFLERAESEGAETVFLEVRESNRAARGLYEKWGFMEVGRRKGYYSRVVDSSHICQKRADVGHQHTDERDQEQLTPDAEDAVVYRKTGLRAKSGQVK